MSSYNVASLTYSGYYLLLYLKVLLAVVRHLFFRNKFVVVEMLREAQSEDLTKDYPQIILKNVCIFKFLKVMKDDIMIPRHSYDVGVFGLFKGI